MQVKHNEECSSFHKIHTVVLQWSVLGPVLYLPYTADLPETHDITIATFADDTAILACNKHPTCVSQLLHEQLNKTENWLNRWKIKANVSKSTHIMFSLYKKDCPLVSLKNNILSENQNIK